MHRYLIIFVVALLLVSTGALHGIGRKSSNRIVLDHADTLRSHGDVRHLIGNVRVHRGDKIMTADQALYDAVNGFIDLTGNVTLSEPGQSIKAQRINYFETTGNYEGQGEVDFTKADSIRIRCRKVRFIEETSTLNLYDNVIINNLSDGATITGELGRWLKNEEVAIIEGEPVYRLPQKSKRKTGRDVSIDRKTGGDVYTTDSTGGDASSTERDTLVIKSILITFHKIANTALFTGDVDLEIGDLLAVSDTLFHQPDSERTELSGAPMIWRGEDQMSGKHIDLYSEDNELKRIIVTGEAVILSEAHEDDERRNRLAGILLNINIINDNTQHVRVEGDAKGEYHIWDEKDEYKGVNLSAADAIEIIIENDQVQEIKLEGKTSGAFYPPGMEP